MCISILHPPVDDPQSGELPCERWNPTQNVRTILLSVISLLNEPNTFSPANVDASVMYRRWRDSKGRDKEYENIIRYITLPPQYIYSILKHIAEYVNHVHSLTFYTHSNALLLFIYRYFKLSIRSNSHLCFCVLLS